LTAGLKWAYEYDENKSKKDSKFSPVQVVEYCSKKNNLIEETSSWGRSTYKINWRR